MKKILSYILLPLILLSNIISPIVYGLTTNGSSNPWTRDKATHLARSVLFYASPEMIDTLEQAGSASAAVNILFPDTTGPDRTAFDAFVTNYTASGFNWGDGNHTIRLYQLLYATDPYEAKRKLFSLFEDIFSVSIDNDRGITYKDIYEQQSLIYANMFGNYQNLVKKILYNNGNRGDFAEGSYLDLFNQQDPKNPNENYARELLQLFLMGEYEPFKSKENEDTRNYEESDVKALARILTGLRSDALTHAVTFDSATHYSGSGLAFLSGTLSGMNPAYYNSASGTIDPTLIMTPTLGNNGITDNIIEYIFAKRSRQIALFLADRIYRFYIHDTPTRAELDTIAGVIESNNFDMFASVKTVLTLDMMYSEKAMNDVRYKNPLELTIGTIKLLQGNSFSNIILDPNVYDTNLLRRLGWTPYFPGSIFGRDGFDNSLKWMSTSNQNAWMSATNYFAYRNGTGSVNFRSLLGNYRKELTTESIRVLTSSKNNFTGSMMVISGILDANIQNTQNTRTGGTNGTGNSLQNNNQNTGTGDTGTGSNNMSTGSTDANNTGTGSTGTSGTGENNTGSGANNTGTGTDSTGTGNTDTSTSNTGSGNTGTGGTGTGNTDTQTGTTDTQTGATDTGSTNSGTTSISFSMSGGTDTGTTMMIGGEISASSGITLVNSGNIMLPNFSINTDAGIITITSGIYNAQNQTLTISSGSLSNSGNITPIYSGTLMMSPSSVISADTLSADTIIDILSTRLLGEIVLPTTVRSTLRTFMETDENQNQIPVTPGTNEYYDKKIRGLISILLSQPEYVLLRGATLPTTTDTTSNRFLDNITGKLIFIELYGGNDYMTSIIPKDEYSTYLDYRTNSSGSIAIQGNNLVDIGNFYMNNALAYGSGGGPGFKSLYDEGSLRIFNRVGGYRHSQDHDAAAKQISSYTDTTAASAEGLFGHLVKSEFESSHTISLGAKMPNIYRGGHYVNMGGSVILSNPLNGSIKQHMDLLSSMMQSRTYPSNTRSLFSDAGRISDIAKISANAGGPSGANGDMNNIFRFTKILMQNNIGRSYYMGGYGGYDTHGEQLDGLNRNLNFVSTAVTNFFNDVKNTQDVTIVIFSEFGRTNKVNGSLGTDHGDGGGMFVITSNQNLKNLLQNGTYGNMSIKNAKANSLGVGIDYRSIYGKIFEGLYGLDGKTYFQDNTISLENDASMIPNTISLLSYSYQASGRNVVMNGEFSVTGSNYNPGKAGYTRILSGTGLTTLKNTSISSNTTPEGYKYTFRLNSSSQPYFQIQSFSNQYALTEVNSTLTGNTVPVILGNSTRNISLTGSSILPTFNNTTAPRVFAGTGIVLTNTGNLEIIPNNNPNFSLRFGSGITQVTELDTASGSLTWNGGFLLGETVDKSIFIPIGATINGSGTPLLRNQVAQLIKIGADKLGIGMKLNQTVSITFRNISDTTHPYRVLTSEDGMNWSDVESVNKEYTATGGNITVPVNHFSYFALVSTVNAPTELPPSCTVNITPSTAYNNAVAQLSWTLSNVSTGTLNPGGSAIGSASGMTNIIPPNNATTTYTISVTNSAGSSSCNAMITTIAAPSGGGTGSGTMSGSGSTSGSGTTNTGTTNTPVTGPGGGGGGRPTYIPIRTKMLDICMDGDFSGDAYDGSCELPSEQPIQKKDTPREKGTYTIESDIQNFVDTYNTSERTENEKNQLGWQVSLKLWKSIANNAPLSRKSKLQEVFVLLYGEVHKTEDTETRKALMKIMQNLQFLSDSSEQMKPKEIDKNQKSGGKIQYVTAENSLAIRSSTKIDNNIIGYLGHDQAVEVLGTFGEWTKIRINDREGFVKSIYLRGSDTNIPWQDRQIPPIQSNDKGWVQVQHTAFIRRGSRYNSQIVGIAHDGDEVTILAEKSGWFEILWNGVHGYIAKWLVKKQ